MNTEAMLKQYKSRTNNVQGHYSVRLSSNQMDVFRPTQGWSSPTRFRLVAGKWVYQHGPKASVPDNILSELANGRN